MDKQQVWENYLRLKKSDKNSEYITTELSDGMVYIDSTYYAIIYINDSVEMLLCAKEGNTIIKIGDL